MSELAESRVLKALNDYRGASQDPIDHDLVEKARADFKSHISHVPTSEKRALYRGIRDEITAENLDEALNMLVALVNDGFGEIEEGFELLRTGRVTHLAQSFGFDLPDPFSGNLEL